MDFGNSWLYRYDEDVGCTELTCDGSGPSEPETECTDEQLDAASEECCVLLDPNGRFAVSIPPHPKSSTGAPLTPILFDYFLHFT